MASYSTIVQSFIVNDLIEQNVGDFEKVGGANRKLPYSLYVLCMMGVKSFTAGHTCEGVMMF